MATPSNIVNVPKPAPGSFNKNRPAGKLLLSHTRHMREGLLKHLEEVARVLAVDIASLKTEGQVSEYVRNATAILHPQGVKHPIK